MGKNSIRPITLCRLKIAALLSGYFCFVFSCLFVLLIFVQQEEVEMCRTSLYTTKVHSFYLSRKFPQIFFTVVYIDKPMPKTLPINRETSLMMFLFFILGDKHWKDISKSFLLVSCQLSYSLKCYESISGAYRTMMSTMMPPIGLLDHNSVHLEPVQKAALKMEIIYAKSVKLWSKDAIQYLQGSLDFKCVQLYYIL